MSKRKSNDTSLPSAKRTALSRFEQQFPGASSVLDNALESWQQCVTLDDDSATTAQAIVQCSTIALDNLYNTIILALLDIRAKAHLKQQEYKQAEIDASEMIQLAPRSPKGYIRRAEVYIHQDNFDDALDIYKQGRECVDDRKVMQQKIFGLQDVLNDKITAYVNECKFARAERFARHWLRLFPHNHRGYTCAGDVYMMQGKSYQAVQAYGRGGLMDQFMDQDASDALMTKFHQACDQADKRVDIIAQSPFDIVANILPHLSTTSLLECLRVSKVWRNKTAQCRSAWRTVVVPQDNDWITEMTHTRCHVTDHVQNLYMDRPDYPGVEFDYAWSSICSTFNHLETLGELYEKRQTDEIDTFTPVIEIHRLDLNTFINGLKETQSTLRRLEISQEDKFWQINGGIDHFGPIWTALSSFQQLTHYSFRDVSASSDGFGERTLPAIPNLTHLAIVTHWLSDRDEASTRRFGTILNACPNLTYLRTNTQNSGLQVIHQRLHKLEYLSLSTRDKILDCHEDFLSQNYKPSNGIRVLRIYSETFPDANTTFNVLNANRQTVEELQLWEVINPFDPDDIMQDERHHWNLLSNFGSTVLRKFDCSLDRLTQPVILSILQQCPNLETVYFTSSTQLTDDVFDALIRLKWLSKLELRDCKKITGEGLARFFESMVTRLKHLHLADLAQDLSDEYFCPLAQVQLTTLYLNGFSDGGPLATIVSRMSSLEEIALRGIKIRIHPVFEKLAKLPKLKKVELMELDGVMDDDIITLVNKSNSVQNISVAYCDTVTSEAIAYANRYISATLFLLEDEE
ncbi:hypothetical protein BJV82DRAFT_666177 [Fennellomyces sp. T-0311]|nr:hypothetical protein BJV82DRAFT_666177 [Fennellomyces sp. T-0311]